MSQATLKREAEELTKKLSAAEARLSEVQKRVEVLSVERDAERAVVRSYHAKLEEWVRRATEAETRLGMNNQGVA